MCWHVSADSLERTQAVNNDGEIIPVLRQDTTGKMFVWGVLGTVPDPYEPPPAPSPGSCESKKQTRQIPGVDECRRDIVTGQRRNTAHGSQAACVHTACGRHMRSMPGHIPLSGSLLPVAKRVNQAERQEAQTVDYHDLGPGRHAPATNFCVPSLRLRQTRRPGFRCPLSLLHGERSSVGPAGWQAEDREGRADSAFANHTAFWQYP